MQSNPVLIGRGESEVFLLPQMANRHGLIAGATGTGKTVTLQVLAEAFSTRGIPVFLADVKGDLAGISQPGQPKPRIEERVRQLGLTDFAYSGCPATFWDVFGQSGHPVRATLSEMGPVLLSRLLQLNETQTGVLHIVFKVADEHGLLLLDLKDLRALLTYVGENAAAFTTRYGNVSAASVGAIQRGLMTLEQQGGDRFFAEPALNLDDLLQTDTRGHGVINLLAAERLVLAPKVYATFLLWMLSELFENLPEVGDLPQPKLVFFFDEAHLLFDDMPPALLEKVEQVVRLIRSKGVGVFFVTQNPQDIPDTILGQLGNRVQHALRAFTPKDQRAIRAAAETFRPNPHLDTQSVLTELAVGEALVSCLDEKGQPGIVQRTLICPPRSQIGPITPDQRRRMIDGSLVAGVYEKVVDRESAYEKLVRAHASPTAAGTAPQAGGGGGFFASLFGGGAPATSSAPPPAGGFSSLPKNEPREARPRGRQPDSLAETVAKSAARTVGSTLGREILRGVLGSIFGGRRR
ncbi:MAG: helicase HerA-like domain-containing protein [Limisphaerales bacterium]